MKTVRIFCLLTIFVVPALLFPTQAVAVASPSYPPVDREPLGGVSADQFVLMQLEGHGASVDSTELRLISP